MCILAIPLSNGDLKTTYMLGKGGNLDIFHQAWVDILSSEAS